MKIDEILNESANTKCIVVDVQPAYANGINFDISELAKFIAKQGECLMFVNADETGLTEDNVEHDIIPFWEEHYEDAGLDFYGPKGLDKMNFIDKGYGYFRSWMDQGVDDATIIKTVRLMYQQKVSDSRALFGGEDSDGYTEAMAELGVPEELHDDGISVEWTSVRLLKEYSGALIMGGGENECLREVELLMNAFNIRYRRVARFVY